MTVRVIRTDEEIQIAQSVCRLLALRCIPVKRRTVDSRLGREAMRDETSEPERGTS